MSGVQRLLLSHDDRLASTHFLASSSTPHRNRRVLFSLKFLAVPLLMPILIYSVLYLQWNNGSKGAAKIPIEPSGSNLIGGPDRDLKLLLHPEDHISRDPTILRFSWKITKAAIAPNGVQKDVFLINNEFPGPTIEARSGDTLEIEVFNLVEEGVSLHWHGLHMREANHMDGPVGITQCAIKPRGNFTYRVPIHDQAGTFWYHAHSEVQRGDGLYGALIVHDPSSRQGEVFQYDHELLFMVGDWYHWSAEKVRANFMSRTSVGNEPCPDSLLINGLGHFECSMATEGAPVNCSDIEKPWILLNKQRSYRVRLINVGSLTGFSFTIPDAQLKAIQVDGGYPITSNTSNSVGILYPAERVDFVLKWSDSDVDTNTEIVIALDKEYFTRPNFALTPIQSFLLSADCSIPQPTINITDVTQFDIQEANGYPLLHPLPNAGEKFMIYTSIEILNRQNSIPKGFINRTTWEPQSLPLIATERDVWDHNQLVPWTGSKPVWVELTINNIDATGHPFHLHGFDFYIISSYKGKGGWDYYNPFNPNKTPRGGPFNLENPLRKDTVYVPAWGYVVIKFLADNEGIWKLHCHILWHHASGMSMAFQVLGDERRGLAGSAAGKSAEKLCST